MIDSETQLTGLDPKPPPPNFIQGVRSACRPFKAKAASTDLKVIATNIPRPIRPKEITLLVIPHGVDSEQFRLNADLTVQLSNHHAQQRRDVITVLNSQSSHAANERFFLCLSLTRLTHPRQVHTHSPV